MAFKVFTDFKLTLKAKESHKFLRHLFVDFLHYKLCALGLFYVRLAIDGSPFCVYKEVYVVMPPAPSETLPSRGTEWNGIQL